MVKICKEEEVWSVIDAAHSIGQETNLNLAEADPDFWVTNCHKWLYAKRGCGLLYVPMRYVTSYTSLTPYIHKSFQQSTCNTGFFPDLACVRFTERSRWAKFCPTI